MAKILTTLPVLAALALAGPALAQDTEEAQDAPKIEDELAISEDGAGAADQPQTYVRETIGDWELKCFGNGAETDPCQMYQLLKDANDNAVAEISLFRLANGEKAVAGATVVVPLETLLTAQLNVTVDEGKPRTYPYAFCNQVGCYSRIGLTVADVDAFKKGAAATVTLVPAQAPDQKVNVTMSLSGFTAAYDKVSELQQ